MKTTRIFGILGMICLLIFLSNTHSLASTDSDTASNAKVVKSYGKLPLSFERNDGQASDEVKFLACWGERVYWFTPKEVILDFSVGNKSNDKMASLKPAVPDNTKTKHTRHVVRISFPGSNPNVKVKGLEQQAGKVNYFIGNDKNRWRTNVPIYRGVIYRNLWDGIDLKYEGCGGNLKYEFVVAPGADPGVIRLAYAGIEGLRVSDSGELVVSTKVGNLIEARPLIYQVEKSQKKQIKGTYRIMESGQVGFSLADYNSSLPLVIDPLVYSTYLGGSGDDGGSGIAVDVYENAYITGFTSSTNFPTAVPYQTTNAGDPDAFVSKIDTSGSLIYSTYLGGSDDEKGRGIAIDRVGNAYITGITSSIDFPTLSPLQAENAGGFADAFVSKLDADGSLIYSTYLGGASWESGESIAVDGSGNICVTGHTDSTDFPVESPYQATNNGTFDAFVAKINSLGSAFVYSTYLGGSGWDSGLSIAVDEFSNAYITGYTFGGFPIKSPYQAVTGGGQDVFVSKINASGSLVYSTYLGGGGREYGYGIAVDEMGNAYVTGETDSVDFPTESAYQASKAGEYQDIFMTKFNASGSDLIYSTYLGGSDVQWGGYIALDRLGNVYVTGWTRSTDFPTTNPYQAVKKGLIDAFVSELNTDGSDLVYSTYLGGSDEENAYGIGVDGAGNAYITGWTSSIDFPTMNPYQSEYGGDHDAFVTELRTRLAPWGTAYRTLFYSPSDLELLRQYRDKILSRTTKGRMYEILIYKSSDEALKVLLDNPELMLEAKYLIEANKDAVSEVLNGNEGVIYNTDEIISFLHAYALKAPPALKILALTIKRDMLKEQGRGGLFFDFRLK